MYPDHTASSSPGLRNFLLYVFNYFSYIRYGVPIFSVNSVTMASRSFKGRELPLHDKHRFVFSPATYNYLSEAILLRCTKYSLETELQKLSSPVPHDNSKQFSLKSIKEIYIPAKIIIPCQFITDPLKSLRIIFHQSLSTRKPDFSFENESTMCTVIAVMIDSYGCVKAVTGKSGWAILQNSYYTPV